MPKQCSYKDCHNPAFSKGRCKWHPVPKEVKNKRTSIPKQSQKQIERLVEYRIVRDKFLLENPICMIEGCRGKSELHHGMGRVGELLTDVSTFRNLCRFHHQFYELRPIEAKALGISGSRLAKD